MLTLDDISGSFQRSYYYRLFSLQETKMLVRLQFFPNPKHRQERCNVSKSVVLNSFAEGSQIQICNFVREPH